MEKRSLSSLFLELDPPPLQVEVKTKAPLRKFNTKIDKPNTRSDRESPRKHTPCKVVYSAKITPNQSILEIGRDIFQVENRIQSTKFSSLPRASSVQKKSLPRLYTESSQKSARKQENLKEKYGDPYKKYTANANNLNPEKEELKDDPKSRDFDVTYSVKHFGVMNGETTLASQRIPIQALLQGQATVKSTGNFQPSLLLNHELSMLKNINRESAAANSIAGSIWNLDNHRSAAKEYETQNDILSTFNEQMQYRANLSPTLGKQNNTKFAVHSAKPFDEEIKYQLVSASQKNFQRSMIDLDDEKVGKNDPNSLMERLRNHLTNVNIEKAEAISTGKYPETRIITSYSFPKKIELRKRKQIEKGESDKDSRQGQGQTGMEWSPRDIPLLKAHNKKMITELNSKVNKEEALMSLSERSKRHGSEGLLANKIEISPIKFPVRLSIKKPEKIEDSFEGNYKKIEDMKFTPKRSQSDTKRKLREKGSYSPSNKSRNENGENKFFGNRGTFQMRTSEVSTNSLYNAFLKRRREKF